MFDNLGHPHPLLAYQDFLFMHLTCKIVKLCTYILNVRCILRKPDFCICENKGANQLCSNCTADQRLCFFATRLVQFFFYLSQNFKPLACFCVCTDRSMLHLVVNPVDQFSRVAAHIILNKVFNMTGLELSSHKTCFCFFTYMAQPSIQTPYYFL